VIKTIEVGDLTSDQADNKTIGISVFELAWWVATIVFGIAPMIQILLD